MPRVMDNIPYSRIHVIYVLRPCAVGFALRNVRDIFLRWPLVVFNISVACHNFKTTVRNKADAFYSDFCFIDIVSFIEGACQVEFQGTYFLPGRLNCTR